MATELDIDDLRVNICNWNFNNERARRLHRQSCRETYHIRTILYNQLYCKSHTKPQSLNIAVPLHNKEIAECLRLNKDDMKSFQNQLKEAKYTILSNSEFSDKNMNQNTLKNRNRDNSSSCYKKMGLCSNPNEKES